MSESSSAALGKKEKALARFLEKAALHLSCVLDLYLDFLSVFDSGIHRRVARFFYTHLFLSYFYTYLLAFSSNGSFFQ